MKYILKSGRFYFTGFDKGWPTWMLEYENAKRYNSKKDVEDENDHILACLKYKCDVIEIHNEKRKA